jgi:membrane-bound serine protease (ClpP class)
LLAQGLLIYNSITHLLVIDMLRIIRILLLAGLLISALMAIEAQAATPATIEVLHVEGAIVPVIAQYIDRGISRAEDEKAAACIIELNTPGGLLDSTEKIVQRIMNADVPVVVYVSPKGAWAASAGTFITLSAHIAAMTPGTTIGAAHPVSAGDEQIPEDEMKKITEFSTNWMEAIAQERGRNAEEAQLAVAESKSFTDVEALGYNLIDLRADNLNSLISQINGRRITLASGVEVTIDTTGYETSRNEMSLVERFLHAISDPNIAYILLSLAMLGLIVELSNPGLIFPGVVGGICLILSFYSLGMLPVNWAGVLLIFLAFGLFVAEAFTPTFGILTAGGITALVLGSLILLPGGSPLFTISPWLIAVVTICIAALFAFVVSRVIQAHRRQASTGREELIGKTAVVKIALDPEGMVFFKGERWTAVSEKGRVEPGEEVTITKVDGLKLWVTRK